MWKKKIKLGLKIIYSSLLKLRKPIVVSFALNNQCNLNCIYCKSPDYAKEKEQLLSKERIQEIMDELKELGTEIVIFSGGEPFLRDQFKEIAEYARHKGFYIAINTNGVLVPENKDIVNLADQITISLEGPEDTNDKIRGEGTFQKIIRAVKISKKHNKEVKLASTINKYNWDKLDYLLDLAEELDVKISFQPVSKKKLFSEEPAEITPTPHQNKFAFKKLLREKSNSNSHIYNPFSNLRHLYRFPAPQKVLCDLMSCRIEPTGEIKQCGRDRESYKSLKDVSFREDYNSLKRKTCSKCWCSGRSTLSQIYSLDLRSIFDLALDHI